MKTHKHTRIYTFLYINLRKKKDEVYMCVHLYMYAICMYLYMCSLSNLYNYEAWSPKYIVLSYYFYLHNYILYMYPE